MLSQSMASRVIVPRVWIDKQFVAAFFALHGACVAGVSLKGAFVTSDRTLAGRQR